MAFDAKGAGAYRRNLERSSALGWFTGRPGIRAALQRAKDVAQGKDVLLSGGADVAQQYLAAGLVDELNLSVVPVLLHSGERLFDKLAAAKLTLEQVRVIEAPGVTHLRYRVGTELS